MVVPVVSGTIYLYNRPLWLYGERVVIGGFEGRVKEVRGVVIVWRKGGDRWF